MAVTELYTGSASIGATETSLTTNTAGPDVDTTDGVFQVFIDLNALLAADQFQIAAYEKVRGADTQRAVYATAVSGPPATPIFVTPSLILMNGWDFTLKKLAGTDRTITWSIRQVA